jgi:lysozyme family protein
MAKFSPAFDSMIISEGGYLLTNIPGDTGGQTYAGISRRHWPNWPGWLYVDRKETPPTQLVRDFYKEQFWDVIKGDELNDQRMAESIFSFAVNTGTKVAVKLAQIVVGTAPDGVLESKTVSALNTISPHIFMPSYTVAKIARYRDIVMKNRSQSKFLLGWINRTLKDA